jgi:hypothetical protein
MNMVTDEPMAIQTSREGSGKMPLNRLSGLPAVRIEYMATRPTAVIRIYML